jgi:hypothetical protein
MKVRVPREHLREREGGRVDFDEWVMIKTVVLCYVRGVDIGAWMKHFESVSHWSMIPSTSLAAHKSTYKHKYFYMFVYPFHAQHSPHDQGFGTTAGAHWLLCHGILPREWFKEFSGSRSGPLATHDEKPRGGAIRHSGLLHRVHGMGQIRLATGPVVPGREEDGGPVASSKHPSGDRGCGDVGDGGVRSSITPTGIDRVGTVRSRARL